MNKWYKSNIKDHIYSFAKKYSWNHIVSINDFEGPLINFYKISQLENSLEKEVYSSNYIKNTGKIFNPQKMAKKKYPQTLFKGNWCELRETQDNFEYLHSYKCNSNFIAFLGYANIENRTKYLGRFEPVCAHDPSKKIKDIEPKLVCLSGMMDKKEESKEQAVIREIKEESGIDVSEKELLFLGDIYPFKGADVRIFLFSADLTGKKIKKSNGDGSLSESLSYCDWIEFDDIMKSKDSVLHSLFLRYADKVVY